MPRAPTKKQLLRAAHIEKCRRSFWHFCKTDSPDFYREDRPHLKRLTAELQTFLETPGAGVLIVEAPPRHGKSRTLSLAVPWILGKYPTWKVITGSYNETVSTEFSVAARNKMLQQPADADRIVYSDIFDTRLQADSKAKNLWRVEGAGVPSYLATSPTGTLTGFGGDVIIIDDLIKAAAEAYNETHLEKLWSWFANTMYSRREGQRKMIIVMTRWATGDLAGRAREHFPSIGVPCHVVTMQAWDGERMLCPAILDEAEYQSTKATQAADIFSANYNQTPIDIEGRLYGAFMEYDDLPPPEHWHSVRSYTDTADTGADYLCSFAFVVDDRKNIYITDALYTQEDMSITEQKQADMLTSAGVNYAHIESNNGGMGFARNVKRLIREAGNTKTIIKTHAQTTHKQSRILTASSGIMNTVHFPRGWQQRWPDLYAALYRYQRTGGNKHDDAPDALTGCWEVTDKLPKKGWRF